MNPSKTVRVARGHRFAAALFVRSGWFSLVCSLLVLAPSGYMLEVYDRVVNSRKPHHPGDADAAGAGRLHGDGAAGVGAVR